MSDHPPIETEAPRLVIVLQKSSFTLHARLTPACPTGKCLPGKNEIAFLPWFDKPRTKGIHVIALSHASPPLSLASLDQLLPYRPSDRSRAQGTTFDVLGQVLFELLFFIPQGFGLEPVVESSPLRTSFLFPDAIGDGSHCVILVHPRPPSAASCCPHQKDRT
jgi:hypothetical protein